MEEGNTLLAAKHIILAFSEGSKIAKGNLKMNMNTKTGDHRDTKRRFEVSVVNLSKII